MAGATNNSDSALSGGFLVILGIIVAAIIGYLVFNGGFGKRTDRIDIDLKPPAVNAPATNPAK